VGMCGCEQMLFFRKDIPVVYYIYVYKRRIQCNTALYCSFCVYGFMFDLTMAILYIAETCSCFRATCFDCLDCVSASLFSYM
jgi:hypothetical protein